MWSKDPSRLKLLKKILPGLKQNSARFLRNQRLVKENLGPFRRCTREGCGANITVRGILEGFFIRRARGRP